jgi:hypothetical protein
VVEEFTLCLLNNRNTKEPQQAKEKDDENYTKTFIEYNPEIDHSYDKSV